MKESLEDEVRNKIAPAVIALNKLAKKEKVSIKFIRIAVRDLKKAVKLLGK